MGVGLGVLGVRNMSMGICYGAPSTAHSSSCCFDEGGGLNHLSILFHIIGNWSNWAQSVDGARRCRTRILKGDFGTLKYG